MSDLPPGNPWQPPTQPPPTGQSLPPGPGQWGQPLGQPPAVAYAGVVNPYDDESTPILVTGILSLVLCGPIGIYAWIKGNGLRDRAVAAGWPEPGTAKVGRILGIVGTIIAAVQVGFLVLWLVLALGIMGATAAGT